MNVASLDLNLLVSLDALLRERSVTKAAQRLNLSQPALSAALARLRRHFGDDLLVRRGNTYELTPLATQLGPRTAVALAGVERVFTAQAEFDPAQCRREFTLLVSDYAAVVLGPHLVRLLAERAPRARLRLSYHSPEVVAEAAERLRTSDAMVIPAGFLTGLPHAELYPDRWVCLVSSDATDVGATVTMDQLRDLPWVTTYLEPTAYTPARRQMELLGLEPRTEIVTDGFLPVPALVAGTHRIALIQERLLGTLPAGLGVRAAELPFDALPLIDALWWHPVSDLDPEHRFLRETVVAAAALVAAEPAVR